MDQNEEIIIEDVDFSSIESYPDELEKYFFSHYKPYRYKNNDWDQMLLILYESKKCLEDSNYPKRDFLRAVHKFNLVPTVGKKPLKSSEAIFANIVTFFSAIGHVTYQFADKTKFIFAIPALSVASFVFMKLIMLIVETFIFAILPDAITPLMLESFVCAFIFIILNVSIFMDSIQKNVLYHVKTHFIKFMITVPLWSLIFILFRDAKWVEDFGYNLFFLVEPHLWISSFSKEYMFSGIATLVINCGISVLISILLLKQWNNMNKKAENELKDSNS